MRTVREAVLGGLADRLERRTPISVGGAVLINPPLLSVSERDVIVEVLREAIPEWQLIETYPNGKVVQVWAAKADGSPFLSFTAFRDYGGRWCRPATADPLPFEPTHWRHLPPPPPRS